MSHDLKPPSQEAVQQLIMEVQQKESSNSAIQPKQEYDSAQTFSQKKEISSPANQELESREDIQQEKKSMPRAGRKQSAKREKNQTKRKSSPKKQKQETKPKVEKKQTQKGGAKQTKAESVATKQKPQNEISKELEEKINHWREFKDRYEQDLMTLISESIPRIPDDQRLIEKQTDLQTMLSYISQQNQEKKKSFSKSLEAQIFLLRACRCIIQSSPLTLKQLSIQLGQHFEEFHPSLRESFDEKDISEFITLNAERKCFGKKSSTSIMYEDQDQNALWCWQIRNKQFLASHHLVMRSTREQIGLKVRNLVRIISLIDKLDSDSKIAKLNQEVNRYNKVLANEKLFEQKALLKKQEKERKQQEREQKERIKKKELQQQKQAKEQERLQKLLEKENERIQKLEEKKRVQEEKRRKEEERKRKEDERKQKLQEQRIKREQQKQAEKEQREAKIRQQVEERKKKIEQLQRLKEQRRLQEERFRQKEASSMKNLQNFFVFGGNNNSSKQQLKQKQECNANPLFSPSHQTFQKQDPEIDLEQFRSLIRNSRGKSHQFYDLPNIFTQKAFIDGDQLSNPRKSVYINISDSFTRVAFYKPKFPLSSQIKLTNPFTHDKELINYDLDSEQEYEDRFGQHLSESEKDCESEDEDEKQYEQAMLRNKKQAKSEAILQKMMNGFVIPDYQPLSQQSQIQKDDSSNFKTQNKYDEDKQKKNYYQNMHGCTQPSSDEDEQNQYQNIILQRKNALKVKRLPFQNTVFMWQVKESQRDQFKSKFESGQMKFKRIEANYHNYWLKSSESMSVKEVIGNSKSLIDHEKLINLISVQKEKLAKNRSAITKYVDQLAMEIHGSYLPKSKIVEMFFERHPDCSKNSIELMMNRISVSEKRGQEQKRKRWFIVKDEMSGIAGVTQAKFQQIERKRYEQAQKIRKQAQAEIKRRIQQKRALEKEKRKKEKEEMKKKGDNEEQKNAFEKICTANQKEDSCKSIKSQSEKSVRSTPSKKVAEKNKNCQDESHMKISNFFKVVQKS